MDAQGERNWEGLLERLGIAVAVVVIYMGYFWINEWLLANKIKAYIPTTWVDRNVPFVGEWVYVYALVVISGFWPMVVVRERYLFSRVALSFLCVQSLAWVCFVLVPVQTLHRPTGLAPTSFVEWGLLLCYWLDLPYCCFPSLHVGMAAMAALACWKVDRWIGGVAIGVAALIGASTLFVKQHYFVDVVGGFVVAGLAYRWWVAPYPIVGRESSTLRFSRWWSLAVPILYVTGVGVAYGAYLSKWTPWQP